MDQYTVLKQYFGHTAFRAGQAELINAILSGRDVLGVMPTGGGKSMCYQIPAILLPGVTLVISPLISLMTDQVAALTKAGVQAAAINSSLSSDQLYQIYDQARRGAYKLLYVAPERLGTPSFCALAQELSIPLVAVDEAHCISQWGQDFRPSYLKIVDFLNSLPRRPTVAAFTATATADVREDIMRLLSLNDPFCTVTGFDRPNLFFDVQRPKHKMAALLELIREREGKSGIVYCATRAHVEQVCEGLCRAGIPATRYHAGLDEVERHKNQDDFQFDRKTVMAATNAFGMGIDKSNVSFVIHYSMPTSLEAYYQEAGRAGRDGEAADCILFFAVQDLHTARFFIENSGNEEIEEEDRQMLRQRDRQRLNAMIGYCKTTGCLRGYILDYFGQAHEPSCGNCGNCSGEFRMVDITIPAQMILSCVVRVQMKLRYYIGKALIVRILCGSKDQRIQELGLDNLSTYGLMKEKSRTFVRDCVDFLESEGYLWTNPAHLTLEPKAPASDVLFHSKKVLMPVRKGALPAPSDANHAEPAGKGRKKQRSALSSPDAELLLSILKETRTRLAQQENVPAYIIFSNATLIDMAEKKPRTMEQFFLVSGVGQYKAARYGDAFLRVIAAYEDGPQDAITNFDEA